VSAHVRDAPGGTLLTLRVIPRARRTAVGGLRGDALLVRLAAPPVDGAANAALLEFLHITLQVPRRQLTLVSGERGRDKTVRVDGLTPSEVESRLGH
jgi:uncharacterized protein